jgi:2-iminobutanoate/2-iminopropanoate deaminase
MKVGLLGGTFNPVHNGHLMVAQKVKEQLNLEQIWFLPTGNHPFKDKEFVLSFEKRCELIKNAIMDFPAFYLKDFDTPEHGFNYTADLIKKLYRLFPDVLFYFIIGEDNIPDLQKWHEYEWLIGNVNFIVVNRPNTKTMGNYLFSDKLTFVTMEPVSISSTEIRRKVAFQQSIENDVPAGIMGKIIQLYTMKEKMMKEISTPKAPQALGAYSQAVEKNGFVYLSGQLGIHPDTNVLAFNFEEEVRQVFANVTEILSASGCTFANVVKVTVFLKDMEHFQTFNSLYQSYFSKPFPAREVVEVARLPRDADVEISMIAMK